MAWYSYVMWVWLYHSLWMGRVETYIRLFEYHRRVSKTSLREAIIEAIKV